MSERYKELAAEAYRSVNPGPDPYNEAEAAWSGFGPLERKFAELIVRECAEVADNADATRQKWEGIGKYVREHFGVEK